VVGHTEQSATTRRLMDLRKGQPDDPTLKNLLGILTAKLELCSRLPVCEWEASDAGDVLCAETFRRLAEAERRSCADVLDCLQQHLERRAALPRGAQA
jgi:hypothetical protein